NRGPPHPPRAGSPRGDPPPRSSPADRPQRRGAEDPAEMVALAAAAVIEDRLATVGVANRAEPRGDFRDGRLPVDLLEGAVGSAAQGMEDPPSAAVLVGVETNRVLPGLALPARSGSF